jgi:serine/threonine-protein kinase
MPLGAGTRLGPYEIGSLLGVGGMGEVYRARDIKLDRDVAIKVLPESFAADPERVARFDREAKTLASLNHPNIGAIHGLEESNGVTALVLELVEGPTLADRIAHGAFPIDEALPIARQIAEALEAAHEHGIIHRDLKPANVKVKDDGTVKVLDFGLAKALERVDARPEGRAYTGLDALSRSPTITSPAGMTGMGMILGTAAYMAPEQARGKPVDKRTDIWAFGCVLYEMLTGRRAFEGDDVSDTLARVLMKDPDWDALPAPMPPAIRTLLRRCLTKDRRQRLSDAADARLEIDDALTAPASDVVVTVPAPPARTSRRAIGLAASATLVLTALVTGAAVWLTMRPAPPRVTRLTIVPPVTAPLTVDGVTRDLGISPDGTRVVYVAANGTALVVRRLDELVPNTLAGLGAPRHPVFSPDGQWIAFFDGNASLKKMAATGGPAVTLSSLSGPPRGASWGANDTIVFATSDPSTGLLRVAAAGGEPEVLTTPDRAAGELDHFWPEALPGGANVLFTIQPTGGVEQVQVAVLDLRTGARRVLVRGGSHAQYVAPGYLVYGAAGTLWAVGFDLARLEVVGAPVPVAEDVVTTGLGGADASVAADGTLVYVPGGVAAVRRTLVWVDRQGREEPLGASPRAYTFPRLSPDGTQVAVSAFDQAQDIWLWDLGRPTLTRLTVDPALDNLPVWTPDGRRLVWASQRAGPLNLYTQAADGTGAVERLTESPNAQRPASITPDGTRVVLFEERPGAGTDLMLLALSGTRPSTRSASSGSTVSPVEPSTSPGRAEPAEARGEPIGEPGRSSTSEVRPLLATPFSERNGAVSPDGRWLAYESNESGQFEIYVRPFPEVEAGKWPVSAGGGTRPLWARSGRELFYRAPDGAVMGVQVEAGGGRFRPSPPATLVEARYYGGGSSFLGRTYDVTPDGARFLMIKEGGESTDTAAPAIVVVQHWVEELKRLVPPP